MVHNFFEAFADAATAETKIGTVAAFLEQLGKRMTGTLSSAVSGVLGPFSDTLRGLLSDEVREASPVLVDFINNRNHEVCRGMTMTRCRQMLQVDGMTVPVIQPPFETPVQKGTPLVLDPPISGAFIYTAAQDGPLFESLILPHIGDEDGFILELFLGDEWSAPIRIAALTEYRIIAPTASFRISDIEPSSLVEGEPWLLGVTFDRDGTFNGSVTPQVVNAPSSLALLILALMAMFPFISRTTWRPGIFAGQASLPL
jgi:hypothetical protein